MKKSSLLTSTTTGRSSSFPRWNDRGGQKKDTKRSSSTGGGDDDEGEDDGFIGSFTTALASSSIPSIANLFLKTMLGVTVTLYVLNQKHMLPRPLSSVVSKVLFWPTLPITMGRRIGTWYTKMDDVVMMGGAPFGFLQLPEKLYHDHGVRGVVNLCEEYAGPIHKYKELGIEHLYLPTTDHFEPSEDDLISAILFIKKHQALGNKVYVHCRAGHGRSAAVVFLWMIYKDPIVDLQDLNRQMCTLRNVRKTLWKQPTIRTIHSRLLQTGLLVKKPGGNSRGGGGDEEDAPHSTKTTRLDDEYQYQPIAMDDISDSPSNEEDL